MSCSRSSGRARAQVGGSWARCARRPKPHRATQHKHTHTRRASGPKRPALPARPPHCCALRNGCRSRWRTHVASARGHSGVLLGGHGSLLLVQGPARDFGVRGGAGQASPHAARLSSRSLPALAPPRHPRPVAFWLPCLHLVTGLRARSLQHLAAAAAARDRLDDGRPGAKFIRLTWKMLLALTCPPPKRVRGCECARRASADLRMSPLMVPSCFRWFHAARTSIPPDSILVTPPVRLLAGLEMREREAAKPRTPRTTGFIRRNAAPSPVARELVFSMLFWANDEPGPDPVPGLSQRRRGQQHNWL
jgi:hypothetical protein